MASNFSLTSDGYDGRSLKLTCEQKTNIATNTSTISWTLTSSGGDDNYYSTGPTTVMINGTKVYSKDRVGWSSKTFPAAKGSVSGTINVTHGETGTKSIKVALSTAVHTYTVTEKSNTWYLDSIPRKATITSAPDFNDEGNPTIEYSNLAGTAVSTLQACISLDGSKDDISYRDISKTGTSYTFNLTTAERNVLRKATTTSNTRTVKFYVKTVIGSNTFYSNVDKTLTIINNKPVFTDSQLSYADTDTSVTAVTKNPLMIVQNKSNLKVTYTEATAKKYATISQYSFTLNGVTKTSKTAGGTVDFGKINSEQDLTLSVTVTDSRDNTVSASKTIKCYPYYSPSFVDFKAYRANDEGKIDLNGTWLKCEYTTNIADVDGTNKRTINIIGVGEEPIPATGNSKLIDLNGDDTSTYRVYAEVADLFGGSNLSTIITIFGDSRVINVSPDGTGVAFGKKSEISECVESRYKMLAREGFYLSNTTSEYPAVVNNEDDLWIGATGQDGIHNTEGGTYISAGAHNNIYASKLVNGSRNNYTILDADNYVDYVSPKPVVLYNSSTGTSGNVSLSNSAANYSYLEILYRNNVAHSGEYLRSSVKVANPNGKVVIASITEPVVDEMRLKVKTSYYLIDDKTIKKENSLYISINDSGTKVYKEGTATDVSPSAHILVYQVLGYK